MEANAGDQVSYTFFGRLGSTDNNWHKWYGQYVLRIVAEIVGWEMTWPWLLFPRGNRYYENGGAWGDYIQSSTLAYNASWSGPVPPALSRYIAEIARRCDLNNRHVVVGASNGAVAASELAMTLAAGGSRVCLILLLACPSTLSSQS